MKRTLNYALLATAVASAPVALAEESDCYKVSEAVTKSVNANPDNVLAVVERQIAANPACACEVVKAAIVATEASGELVGQIVGAAIEAAPEQINVITSCAIAVAPDAIPHIQKVVAKLNRKIDTRSSKGGLDSAKGAEVVRNPLEEVTYLPPGEDNRIHPPFPTIPSTCTPSSSGFGLARVTSPGSLITITGTGFPNGNTNNGESPGFQQD